jgi:hypothetical protein
MFGEVQQVPHGGKSYLELEQQLKRREAPMAAVIDRLAPAQGAVHAIHFNAMTGSVIVEYDAGTRARTVLRALDHAGYRLMRRRSQVSTPTGATELPAARAVLPTEAALR